MRQRKYEEFDADNGTALRYSRHENGGGFVESRARVATTAHVGPSAYVDRGAIVGAYARIGSGAWIDGGAVVHEGAVIGPAAHIGPGAVVGRGAKIGSARQDRRRRPRRDAARVESDEIIRPSAVVHASSRGRRAACSWRPEVTTERARARGCLRRRRHAGRRAAARRAGQALPLRRCPGPGSRCAHRG